MLSESVQQFLETVNLVCELEERDAELAGAGQSLFIQLAHADEEAWSEVFNQTMAKLGRIRAVRREIAAELTFLRSSAALQVLGRHRGSNQ